MKLEGLFSDPILMMFFTSSFPHQGLCFYFSILVLFFWYKLPLFGCYYELKVLFSSHWSLSAHLFYLKYLFHQTIQMAYFYIHVLVGLLSDQMIRSAVRWRMVWSPLGCIGRSYSYSGIGWWGFCYLALKTVGYVQIKLLLPSAPLPLCYSTGETRAVAVTTRLTDTVYFDQIIWAAVSLWIVCSL